MRTTDRKSDTVVTRDMLKHILSTRGESVREEACSLLVSDELKLIRSRWDDAIGAIPHVSAEGRWCVREGGEAHIVEGFTVRIVGLRRAVTLHAQQDMESGLYVFGCECCEESLWLPARRIDRLLEDDVDQVFAEFLDWWGAMVA